MKIFTTDLRRQADIYTIANDRLTSHELMLKAAENSSKWIADYFYAQKQFAIFAGIGNNGGDGLAIAYYLTIFGKKVKVFIIQYANKFSEDFDKSYQLLKEKNIDVTQITENSQLTINLNDYVVIDCIFGSGLSRPAQGIAAQTIDFINSSPKIALIAIDIPSGLQGENNDFNATNSIIKANYTLTFEYPFLSFMFPENDIYIGEFIVIKIGISKDFITNTPTKYYLLEESQIENQLKKRQKFSHKGTYGHALLIAGSYGKFGAAVLAAKAAHRSGLGLLTAHVPHNCVDIMQISSPETLLSIDKNNEYATSIDELDKFNAIGIGPAIGFNAQTIELIETLFKKCNNKKFVIDADAITIIAQNKHLQDLIPQNAILTPHPKELQRLIGNYPNGYQRLEKQIEFSVKYKVIIVQKGANSAISTPDGNVFFNSTGNPGMATGGSGDVLTGIILGLLAQDYEPLEAAKIGVYYHGLAADIATQNISQMSLTPSDIINYLGKVMK